MIVDGFVMVMTISSISYWFHIVTTMLIINLVTIFSKAIYAMLKLEDVRGLFSHESFFSSIVLLPMASWTISQVFPLHSQVRTQWRLLAKALMTPRSKSMNPIQKSPKSQSEIFGSWGSSYQYQYIYIYIRCRSATACRLKSGARPSMDDAFFCFLACLPRVPSPAVLRWPLESHGLRETWFLTIKVWGYKRGYNWYNW